jgi:hypothetical protein
MKKRGILGKSAEIKIMRRREEEEQMWRRIRR